MSVLDRVVAKVAGKGSNTAQRLALIAEQHCDGELSHADFRREASQIVAGLSDGDTTKIAEKLMALDF